MNPKEVPSTFTVRELISLAANICGVEPHFASGAMRHFNVDQNSMMTTEVFKSKVESFANVGAF
jgi:hypothetical protein